MTTATFTAYARVTHYDSKDLDALGVRLDHVFVISSLWNNWNCFGGGIEEAREDIAIATAQGYVEWARLIYGPENEGKGGRLPNAFPASGVTELFNGVCQNAANRILVFTDDNIDVRKANANALVTLLYGKYGFDLDVFIGFTNRLGENSRQRAVYHCETHVPQHPVDQYVLPQRSCMSLKTP